MKNHPYIYALLGLVFIASIALLAMSVNSMNEANQRLGQILDIKPEVVNPPSVQPAPSIDDQILSAQNKLRSASNGIRTRKVQINVHASQAIKAIDDYSARNLEDARRLLNDILENSRRILQQNEKIEAETLRLYNLYQRKIEKLLAAKQAQNESKFGISFWAGLVGLLATISGLILAWRRDNLDHKKDQREILELQQKLANEQVA